MNVEFSFSSSPKAPQKYDSGITEQQQDKTENIKSETDLENAKRQGVVIPLGDEQLIKRIEQAVKALEGPTTTLEFSIHKPTHSIMAKVINKNTGELIREIPPEKTLDLVANMMKIAGIIIDERA
ncbi:flagellar protein FlaG [Paenibacillus physcomitrellae]|uniref:Flagellin n=1 Tax=Paenibacillus physcomitrellae TaxID=1619311 RepID=A0ABQ1GH19_9BACL|nr:flagellar protein FlaG [Paenibacillus physcomitrellae]GGA43641.1 flagellin [Paenibacillus physcomitrellae]